MTSFLKNKKIGLILLFTIFYLLLSAPVHAQTNDLMTNLINGTPVLPQADLIGIIFKVIQYVLAFVGVVAVVIMIYGGFLWMTARGNDEQVNKAKKVLINGLVGLIVILLSYAIVQFAISRIDEISQPPGQACEANQCVSGCWRCNGQGDGTNYDVTCPPCGGGQGGSFVVRWTYPKDKQDNISLCSLIQAGFNDQLDPDSVNKQTVKITLRDALKLGGESCNENTECKSGKCQSTCQGDTVDGQFRVVDDVFKFSHLPPDFSDFEKNTWYRVLMTTGIRSSHGRALEPQRSIEFKTGDQEDTTPPTVENVYPENNQENVCLQEPIQSIFSEAMDVTTLVDIEALTSVSPPADPHEFRRHALNEKTLEATPKTSYLSGRTYDNTLNANIITDVCGNHLAEDYLWSFITGNTLKCQPVIDSITPTSGYYNDQLIISGNYFRLAGDVVFSRDVYPNDFCFNTNNFPDQACLISWTNQEIKIKVPAAGGASQGAISGPVYVKIGGVPSNSKYFNLQSPYLQSFSPSRGGRGQAITLRGINFGNIQNKVYFIPENDPSHPVPGVLICDQAGWRDYEIIVAVPDNMPTGNYYLQIERQDGKFSNVRLDETFEVNKDQPGPTLCDITPYCLGTEMRGGKETDKKILPGKNFKDIKGKVYFDSVEVLDEKIIWTDEEIGIEAPKIQNGTHQVKVVTSTSRESNPLTFISPCFEQGGFGDKCFLNENTCLLEKCSDPYECKSSANPQLECRCCCDATKPNACPAPLQCDETQPCYKSGETEITGACCGCTNNNQCQQSEICKQQGPNQPNCCFTCEIGDDSKACKGGECCSNDCGNFTNGTECSKHDGCSWNGLTCQGSYEPYCCAGRCSDHKCLSLCGNGQIDGAEECDPGTLPSPPGPPENLNGKTCVLLGYQGGDLHCNGTCKFQVNDCLGAGGPGNWGEKCINLEIKNNGVSYCTTGRDDCSLALGAKCVQNVEMPPFPHCACCCQPGDEAGGITDSCKITNCVQYLGKDTCSANLSCFWDETVCKNKLSCSTDKACGDFGQKGLCCGCDVDAACGDYMVCHTDKCCYPLPAPTDLKFLASSKDQINLSWEFSDDNHFGTDFEIYKKYPGDTIFSLLATCNLTTYECDLDNAELILQGTGLYNFKDKRGNFETKKDYTYKVRTKKGTTYSRETVPVAGQISGTSSCQENSDCSKPAPCCREDSNICVDWNNCQGYCQEGGNCVAPSVKFATADFLVTKGELGPCLIKIDPRLGKINDPIILTGLRFGNVRGSSEVTFSAGGENRINAHYPVELLWTNQRIDSALVSNGTADGEVRVVVDNRESNGISFDFIPQPVGPGDLCFYEDVCNLNPGYCSSPFTCLVNSNDCRCCCAPTSNPEDDLCKNINSRLECSPNQGTCTGDNRGLCCGCQTDSDCGDPTKFGCGTTEPTPKCCHNRPTWEDTSFCDGTSSEAVKVNSGITLNFSDKMDFKSLNKDNVKVSRDENCLSIEEGQTINNRCYLNGNIGSYNNENNKTVSVFSPKLCQLKPEATYQIEIVVDQESKGVKSGKGVFIYNSDGACSWDQTKKCQIKQFTTINDKNNLCKIEWIDVQPRNQFLKDVNQSVQYQAIARDTKNQSVCVQEFEWSSSDENIAVVTSPGLETTATSKGVGQGVIIIARITSIVPNKTCLVLPDNNTCGLLNVSLQGPKVVEQKTCETCNLGGQSPSPSNFSADACLAAQIVARFDKEMRQSTLNNSTIKVVECGEDLGKCESPIPVNGQIKTWEKGFLFKALDIHGDPTLLSVDKVYRVTLLSGSSGIKDTSGLELDGNKNTIQDGSPSDDYVWYFKTQNNDNACPLSKICVDPPSDTVVIPDQLNATFSGRIYTQNCNYLEADDSTWQWSSLDEGIATVKPISPKASTVATGLVLGQTKIKALAEGQEAQASLIVVTHPVAETYPSGKNLCLNTAIWAFFDQKMDEKSFIGNFKVEKESDDPHPQWDDVTSNFSTRFALEEKDKTKVYFVPKTFLDTNKQYKITILKNVKSIEPYSAEMENSKAWNFTTGSVHCRLEKVQVEPSQASFNRAKETKDFMAKAFYQNTEIQGVPGYYNWLWSWQSTNTGIATVAPISGSQEVIVTSGSKNGVTSIIATAKITEDKIFIPSTVDQEKKGTAKVEVWLCENPWPSINYPETGETYKDSSNPSSNFSFRYCRDAGASGLDGDLPILKGGLSKLSSEPGLTKLSEHFFTVYDGALSLFYDGSMSGPASQRFVVNKSGYNNFERYKLFGDNNGAVSGVVIQVVNGGKFSDGLSFNGNSYLSINYNNVPVGRVPIGRNATIEMDKFTLEAWVNTKETLAHQYIFKKGNNLGITGANDGYGLEVRDDGKVYFWLFDKKNNKVEISADFINSGGIIAGWKHLAATYDGRNSKLYVNGIVSPNIASTPAGGVLQSDTNLLIGAGFKGTLDDIAFWQKALTQAEIEKHIKTSPTPTLGDVIGFKVFSNFEHLKSDEWYRKNAPGQEQSGSSKIIDGYAAHQVGRTVYVAATNVNALGPIYTNLYLVSYNDKAQPGTNQTFESIINNWKFNINIFDEDKLKLTRDLQRIYDFKTVGQTLESYKDVNTKEPGYYPRLSDQIGGGGSWVVGMSTSKWNSWTVDTGLGQDLKNANLSVFPSDPVNTFSLKKNCGQSPTYYDCCADCPSKNPSCSQQCYNTQTSKYEGVSPCYIYQYMADGNPVGTTYGFYTTFEYFKVDNWQHQCEALDLTACQNNAFCYWEATSNPIKPGVYGTCKKKILNYLGTNNPCASNGNNCACFNAKLFPASTSMSTVTP